MATDSIAEKLEKALHRIQHWLKLNPCELVEIMHETTCPGFCFTTPGVPKQCNWGVKLRCKSCGELEILG